MQTKIIKNFCYDGLGFPVEIKQVELVEINNEWHPKIDVRKISDIVIEALAYQQSKLTGNQVRFIRTYFSMPLRKFGQDVVHETHAAVGKWEKAGNNVTSMNDNTEYVLRLYIIEQLCAATKKQKEAFFSKYQNIKNFFSSPVKYALNQHVYI